MPGAKIKSMKNFLACGDVLDYTVTGSAVVSGQAILIGDLLGIAVTSGAVGDVIAVQVEGVYSVAKRVHASSAAMVQGSSLYWDATNSWIDNTSNSGANKMIGWAYVAAASTDTTVQIRLLGT